MIKHKRKFLKGNRNQINSSMLSVHGSTNLYEHCPLQACVDRDL